MSNLVTRAMLAGMVGTLLFAGPASAQSQTPPAATPPANQQTAQPDADMAKVLAALAALNPKPIETLSADDAREQPSAADAVKKVIKDEKLKVEPHKGLEVDTRSFADMGNLKLRWYTPEGTDKNANLPVIVYFRGGGWVIATLDTYDASAAALARKAKAIVVSVDYPLAPENKFPAAHQEAVDAYKYIAKNAKGWGGDPNKIALVGESAGGNLAVATAMAARDQNLQKPIAIVSIYPVATTSQDTPSKKQHANAKPLNTAMMAWFFDKVLPNEQAKQDPRLNLVGASLRGLPPVTVINAEIDPLASEGAMLVEKLKADGVQVTHKVYDGVTHEFFGMDAVVQKAAEAQDFAVAQIKAASGGAATQGAAPPKQ